MGETTKKFDDFMSRPLQDCDIKNVPGVGDVALAKLKDANIDTAEKLIGHFLLLGRDTDKMSQWLKDVCEVRSQESGKIAEALQKKAAKIVTL
jgi:hypothetical protein